MYGNRVVLKYRDDSPFGNVEDVMRNVTEIHYNFPSPLGQQVAFESDVHQTGKTVFVSHIQEFETFVETEAAVAF